MTIGDTIGSFKIVARLGSGGMGDVYLGEQQAIDTRVAIKVLRAEISRDMEHVQRFFNEARAVGRIKHAGTVKIFEGGFLPSGHAYLIMELLEGETLSARIRHGRIPVATLCDLGRQIASILAATHAVGITHRDLKPDNIFIVADAELASGERVKILDFGIAKLTGTLANGPRTVGTMGTPSYMAPEQWGDSANVDWRADAYSLGCVLFEMACGRPPFLGSTFADLCAKHLSAAPPTPTAIGAALPPRLEQLVMRLLAKDAAARCTSLAELGRELDAIGREAPPAPAPAALAATIPPEGAASSGVAPTLPPTIAPTAAPTRAPSTAPSPVPLPGGFVPHVPPPRASADVDVPRASAEVDVPRASAEVDVPRASAEVDVPRASADVDLARDNAPASHGEAREGIHTTTMRSAVGQVHGTRGKRGGVIALASIAVVAAGVLVARELRGGANDAPVEPAREPPGSSPGSNVAVGPDAGAGAILGAGAGVVADAAAPPPVEAVSLDEIARWNPFLDVNGVTLLSHQVTQREYKIYLATLHPNRRHAAVPLLENASPLLHDAQGGLSQDRARAFCRALGADLPTVAQWKQAAGKRRPWAIHIDGSFGELQEWTADVENGLATVMGAPHPATEAERAAAVREPLLKATEATAGASTPNVVADRRIGFRCAR